MIAKRTIPMGLDKKFFHFYSKIYTEVRKFFNAIFYIARFLEIWGQKPSFIVECVREN